MRTAALTALFLLAGIASAAAEADADRAKLMAEPKLTQPVIDAHILASRKVNILRLRVLAGQNSPGTPGPAAPGTLPFAPIVK